MAQAEQSPRKWKVLLVDDDEEEYRIIQNLLGQVQGAVMELSWVDTAEAFLAQICGGGFDVYLMDYRLKNANGLELVAKHQAMCAEIPGILLTGWQNYAVLEASQRFGAASFISKNDLTAENLLKTIQKVTAGE